MATLNTLDFARPTIGQQAPIVRATLTAITADDTAGFFTIDLGSKLKAVDSFMIAHRASNGQLKASRASVSGSIVTITDGAVDVILANDTITIWAEGPVA
jgi:hypothetical protein